MIGGQDLIPCAEPSVALDLATRTVIRYWSEALLEDSKSATCCPRIAICNSPSFGRS